MTKKRPPTERQRDAERKRRDRAAASVIIIPRCEDPARRKALEADDQLWLMWYFGRGCGLVDPFWYEFTEQQVEMIGGFGHAIDYGGDQAFAASRGEGKTTLFERQVIKYTCQGKLDFSVLFAATGRLAEDSLDSIKLAFEENTRLAADYPEICTPIAALNGVANRAGYAVASGFRHDNGKPFEMRRIGFEWSGQEIVLPNVPGSPAARAIIATRGLDSAVRGIKRKGRRVKLAGIDDPDTEETARSEEQANKLATRIHNGIGGLGDQQNPVARILLSTIQSTVSVSARFTDPIQEPSFKGRRFRFMITPPANQDLWDQYIEKYKEDCRDTALKQRNDPHCRRSHAFYVENFEAMNEGAVVSNPNRFNGKLTPDGTPTELTAIQHYHNRVARTNREAVACELDNDPIEIEEVTEAALTPHRIQKKVNGYGRKQVPPGCVKLTRGIDVRKIQLHWVVRAWKADGTPFTIDYGVYEIHGTKYGSDEGVDTAIKRAILAYLEESKEEYSQKIDRTCIDASYRTDAVYAACREAGAGVTPIMGAGKSNGCTQPNFHEVNRRAKDKRPGDGYFLTKKSGGIWLCMSDADRWKNFEHDRWLTAKGEVGCGTIFGQPHDDPKKLSQDERDHHAYSHHICNEAEVDEVQKDGTMRKKFRAKSNNTHWLDASAYSDTAAAMEGIQLFGGKGAMSIQAVHEMPSLQELAGT